MALAVVGVWIASSACQLGDGSCLRMSDCDRGYVCEEGACVSNLAADAPLPSADAAAAPKTAMPTSNDASSAADSATTSSAQDAGSDGFSDDASSAIDGSPSPGSGGDDASTDAAPDV